MNSFHLIEELKNIRIKDDFSLVSLDVVSLFTNVPLDIAIDCINEQWNCISRQCSIPREEFLEAVKLVLDSTFFVFDKKIYKQSFGTPMGSPLSPVVADLVMRRLEGVALMSFNKDVPFYYRYVDDICLAVSLSDVELLKKTFNDFHPRLQFTLENGGNKLEFLDVTILKHNNGLIFDWYRKPTFSGRFLNYMSNHPVSQKRGMIFSLVDRAFLLSDVCFHKKNLRFIIETLLNNDYPMAFIFNTVNQRIKHLINNKINALKNNSDNVEESATYTWLTVPYIPTHSEKFKRIKCDDIRVSFRSPNKINKYIKVQKDPRPKDSKNNVVYEIECKDCAATYVGQTGRQLKTRIAKHKNHIRRNTTNRSVITEHRLEHNHDFQWDNVRILDEEPCYMKRLISEMINIKKQTNSLNLQTDTEGLHKAYIPIINKL
ncbi:PREDICTED: uncharacterized protein LOC108768217 [Trachymyrmex cornetzi]|uniref:uncharacterized protein LOC108768217 n=1 Tax=Trachymyrmex cornetzi TaxID=471704 RepID=UPI00084EE20E|nr:PREDICTED: uncharacterized protein LOC108768217 [Trachymyrmex cornetzi]